MLIVEGPDGAGKSTLIHHLCEEYGFEVGQRAVSDRSKLYTVTRQDTYTALAEAVKGDGPAQIWDRLFFSEMVYAPVVHRTCEFSPWERNFVTRTLEALGAPVVVCLPPVETVRANAAKAEQMKGVNENIGNIYRSYDKTDLGWPSTTLWYDYTWEATGTPGGRRWATYNEICGAIDTYLSQREEREWNAAN